MRDSAIGRKLNDVDIATSARPEAVMSIFAHAIPTGLKHGTVTVIEQGQPFEITTFRTEKDYSDGRRPDQVVYVADIHEDLSRRDFTINAMAIDLEGALIDPFGGATDLSAGIVRCVGDATLRFSEDGLRMLRAIRFAAEFDFRLDEALWSALLVKKAGLQRIAMERVGVEWDKMIAGNDPARACRYLFESGLLLHVQQPLPRALLSGLSRTAAFPHTGDSDQRWAALFVSCELTAAEAREVCAALRLSGARSKRIKAVVGFDAQVRADGRLSVASEAYEECEASEEGCLLEAVADYAGKRERWIAAVLDKGVAVAQDWLVIFGDSELGQAGQDWLTQMPIVSLSELAVKGHELADRLGRKAGPWVAEMLAQLAFQVALGRMDNEKSALLVEAEVVAK